MLSQLLPELLEPRPAGSGSCTDRFEAVVQVPSSHKPQLSHDDAVDHHGSDAIACDAPWPGQAAGGTGATLTADDSTVTGALAESTALELQAGSSSPAAGTREAAAEEEVGAVASTSGAALDAFVDEFLAMAQQVIACSHGLQAWWCIRCMCR